MRAYGAIVTLYARNPTYKEVLMGDVLDRSVRDLFRESASKTPKDTAALLEAAFAMLVREAVPVMEQMEISRLAAALREEDQRLAVMGLLADLATESLVTEADEDPLAQARATAAQRRREILAEAGGGLSTAALAKALGVTRQAIDKRRRARTLLAVPRPSGDWAFPRAQFGPGLRPLPGLTDVLRAFHIEDPWMQLSELLTPDEDLGVRSIFQVLREEGRSALPAVLGAVTSIGEHAA